MGGFKKYEAHARRFSLCCFPIDIHRLVVAVSALGVVLSVWFMVDAAYIAPRQQSTEVSWSSIVEATHIGAAVAYLVAFACVLAGELRRRERLFIVFLAVNGTAIFCTLVAVFAALTLVTLGPTTFGYQDQDVESYVENYWQHSFVTTGPVSPPFGTLRPDLLTIQPQITFKSRFNEHEEAQISLLLLLSTLTSTFLLATLFQSIVYHAYRFVQLRRRFDYPQNDLVFPHNGIYGLNGGSSGGGSSSGRGSPPGGVGNGGHYISNMRKISIFSTIPYKS